MNIETTLTELGLAPESLKEGDIAVTTPIDGSVVARLQADSPQAVADKIAAAEAAFKTWRLVPPPKRGEMIRLFGVELRAAKEPLGRLVSIESGKILAEGLGEVQEMIDICDFALGLSRQLYGLTIASERSGHRMMETWHPLGPVGVISAFNFPVAVWAWNFALAVVCGDSVIWKPSEKTPLCALACEKIFRRAVQKFSGAPDGVPADLMQVAIGGGETVGRTLTDDPRIPLISATGSTRMGKIVAPAVAARLGRSLLELGGNNAMIVAPTADLDLAERAIVFSAVGTAGQRCTSLRRLIVHKEIYDDLLARLKRVYAGIPIGSPLDSKNLMGPLIGREAFETMEAALIQIRRDGGTVAGGGRTLEKTFPNAWYVQPAIAEMPAQTAIVKQETFAPILYAMRYSNFDDAIAMHNDVPQGLASAVFTGDVREAERFLSPSGSDCGIANVNIGPSGAEIGGAFGGEKETGGGRESGSDAWKNYMRRATNTINYSAELPLAQGIQFGGD
ncbi:MAG: aldehyde dehydrogenase family protein [Rhodospirillales bacterium]